MGINFRYLFQLIYHHTLAYKAMDYGVVKGLCQDIKQRILLKRGKYTRLLFLASPDNVMWGWLGKVLYETISSY